MTAAAYSNELEQQFSQLPGWLQAPLSGIYHEIDGWLKAVAGNPQELLQAGTEYAHLAAQIKQIADEQHTDRVKLLAGQWEGAAYDAFSAAMSQLEAQIDALAQATGNTTEVLASAAQACTEGADAICQIFAALIAWLITSFVVNAVLAIFTFGISLAAEVAEAVAGALESLAQITMVVEKVATVLEKIAEVLQKIAETMRAIKAALEVLLKGVDRNAKVINEDVRVLRLLKPIGGRTNVMDAVFPGGVDSQAGLGWKVIFYGGRWVAPIAETAAVTKALDLSTGGVVSIPGLGTEALHAGESVRKMLGDLGTVQQEAR